MFCWFFFDGKLIFFYLDFLDILIYKLKWYFVWNKLCYYFYLIFIFEENLMLFNLIVLKKEEVKLWKFYEKNCYIFDNIYEFL